MGSLIREKRYRILLALTAATLLVGLLSPVSVANDTFQRKIRRLEVLGLNPQDPEVIRSAVEAHALYSVDVLPKGDNINVVLQLSGLPNYDSYLYTNSKRRLVLDLRNTINIAPTSTFLLDENDPILKVRNSQYRVTPSIISRVVLELNETVVPEITSEGNNLVISAPMYEAAAPGEAPFEILLVEQLAETGQETVEEAEIGVPAGEVLETTPPETMLLPKETFSGEIVSVPAVEVETESPEVEVVLAEPDLIGMGSAAKEAEPAEVSWETEEAPAVEESAELSLEAEIESIPVEEISEEPAGADVTEIPQTEAIEGVEEEIPAAEIVEFEEIEISEPEVVEVIETEEIETIEPVAEIVEAKEIEPVETAAIEFVEVEEAKVEIAEVEEIETVEVAEAEIIEAEKIETTEIAEVESMEPAEDVSTADEEAESPEPIKLAVLDIETAAAQEAPVEVEAAEIAEPVEAAEEAPEEIAGVEEEAAAALNEMISEMMESMAKGMAQMEQQVAAPAPKAFVPEANAESAGELSEEETLVTLTFRDADLNAVLDILAKKGKLNILAGKEIRGRVTVRLVDVPLDVALNAILNVNGYGYMKKHNIIRILPLSEIGEQVNTVTETFDLSYANAVRVKQTLEAFLSSHGSIETDDRTNMLVITDNPVSMERVRDLIPKLDRRVQQVLIEVIILDSVLLDDADLGVSWGLLDTTDRSPNTREGGGPFPDQINVTLPTGSDALQIAFGTLIGDFDLNGFIDAVVSDSDSRVLANPKILTLDNETATIEIIQEFPYNDVTQTSSGGQLSNITFKEIGTKLEVKPQITHDGHVILWIAPEQNSIAGTTAIGVPIVDTRKAETTLIVKNHQTIVMGGLRENRNVNTITKVPFFGDLPGLKYAFRNVQSDKQDSELLVFLTVHIVESPELLPHEKLKAEELANMPRHPNSTIELIRP